MIWPTRPDRRTRRVKPEEVLLQITLAFMVVLGFLLSSEEVARSLLDRNLQRVARAVSEGFVDDVAENNRARAAEERMVLLNAWLTLKSRRELFTLLGYFEEDDGPLATWSTREFAADPMFQRLRTEVQRLYAEPGSGRVNKAFTDEIGFWVLASIQEAEYLPPEADVDVPHILRESQAWHAIQVLSERERQQEKVASIASVKVLTEAVVNEFHGQRDRIVTLQKKLVARIGLSRMVDGSLETETTTDTEEVLRSVVRDLDKQIGLLPEVRDRFLSDLAAIGRQHTGGA